MKADPFYEAQRLVRQRNIEVLAIIRDEGKKSRRKKNRQFKLNLHKKTKITICNHLIGIDEWTCSKCGKCECCCFC